MKFLSRTSRGPFIVRSIALAIAAAVVLLPGTGANLRADDAAGGAGGSVTVSATGGARPNAPAAKVGSAQGEILLVAVDKIHPTQPAAGFYASDATGAARFAAITEPDALAAKLASEKPLHGVRGPGGEIYLTDGHHRALSAFRAARRVCADRGADCRESARVRILLDGDYSADDWPAFYDSLAASRNVYLPPDVRARVERGQLAKARVFSPTGGVLPADLAGLRDDPMRSAIGTLFYKRHLDGSHFENYLEFFVGEQLAKRQFALTKEEERAPDPRLVEAVFGDAETVIALRCLARRAPAEWKEAQTEIDTALAAAGHADATAKEWQDPAASAACDLRASVEQVNRMDDSTGALNPAIAPCP